MAKAAQEKRAHDHKLLYSIGQESELSPAYLFSAAHAEFVGDMMSVRKGCLHDFSFVLRITDIELPNNE